MKRVLNNDDIERGELSFPFQMLFIVIVNDDVVSVKAEGCKKANELLSINNNVQPSH